MNSALNDSVKANSVIEFIAFWKFCIMICLFSICFSGDSQVSPFKLVHLSVCHLN